MIVPASPLSPAREGDGSDSPDGQAHAGGVRVGVRVSVRTPATSANLGPGFDSLGLALSLYDEIEVVAGLVTDGAAAVEVNVEGEGVGVVPCDEHHLVVRAIRAGLEHAGAGPVRLALHCRNVIPHGRGLGSSASAVVAGLVAARGLLTDPSSLDDAALLRLATAFEGHPDNAAAALLGGFTVSWTETGPGPLDGDPTRAAQPFEADPAGTALPSPPEPPALFEPAPAPASRRPYPHLPDAHAVTMPVHPDLRVVACVPQLELATSVARKMLPAEVPHGDAAFNAGRSALLVEAMARRPELLFAATADRLHQCQRAAAMPDSARLVRELRGAGAAAVVSGAGPTVLVLGTGESPRLAVREVLERMDAQSRWRVLCLVVDTVGATEVTHSRDL